MTRNDWRSRRAFLRSAGAVGGVAGGVALAGCSASDLDPRSDDDSGADGGDGSDGQAADEAWGDVDEIQLEAYQEGWEGVEPEPIAGVTNPKLKLETTTEYEIAFENADGVEHELQLRDDQGEPLESSDDVEEEGATGSVQFEATEEMTAYVCEYHESSMEGEISFTGE